jgi:hypothetical protein
MQIKIDINGEREGPLRRSVENLKNTMSAKLTELILRPGNKTDVASYVSNGEPSTERGPPEIANISTKKTISNKPENIIRQLAGRNQ